MLSSFFKPPASPPAAVLLADDRFFTAAVPLASGPEADGVAAQVELALEAAAPFPVAQLYYGYFTRPGAGRALVFAAYRKRFSPEESEAWAGAELVAPAFAALLPAPAPAGATTWVIARPEGLTAVHFDDDSGVPSAVRVCLLPPEASEAERAAARDGLLREFPGSRAVADLPAPAPDAEAGGGLGFRAGPIAAVLAEDDAGTIDVRDKAELAMRQRAQVRDRWLWRGLQAAAAVVALCALTELALLGGRVLLGTRTAEVTVQAPLVAEIMTKQTLATRIEEMASKRLLPLEMISLVSTARPAAIQFLSTTTNGLYTLEVQAQTDAQGEIDAFQSALGRLPACERVEVQDLVVRAGVSTFKLVVTFKPEAVRPAENPTS